MNFHSLIENIFLNQSDECMNVHVIYTKKSVKQKSNNIFQKEL